MGKLFTTAVIAAAGSGTRMGNEYSEGKLFIKILGVPVLARTMAAFEKAELVDQIVVVCREEDEQAVRGLGREYGISKLSSVTRGSFERQLSVKNGIEAADPKTDYIAVHDGARMLVTPQVIDETIKKAYEFGAAAVGAPVKDTLKVMQDGFVQETIPRDKVIAIATPQVFLYDRFKKAIAEASEKSRHYTDDCQLFERGGGKIAFVMGGYDNIKITTKEDICHAEAILLRREGAE